MLLYNKYIPGVFAGDEMTSLLTTHTYGGVTQLEVSIPHAWAHGELTVSVSWPRLWTATHGTLFPSLENAAEAVHSTPHSCLTTTCPTHCSPAHAKQCPLHRLSVGLNNKRPLTLKSMPQYWAQYTLTNFLHQFALNGNPYHTCVADPIMHVWRTLTRELTVPKPENAEGRGGFVEESAEHGRPVLG